MQFDYGYCWVFAIILTVPYEGTCCIADGHLMEIQSALFASNKCIKMASIVIPVLIVKVMKSYLELHMIYINGTLVLNDFYLGQHFSALSKVFFLCRSMCNVWKTSSRHQVIQTEQCMIWTWLTN